MLNSDTALDWEQLNTLLNDHIKFARDFVNITNKEGAYIPADLNPEDTKYIQKKYRSNRRRAVREVLEEKKSPRNIPPDVLAKHFYPDTTLQYDPNVYDNMPTSNTPLLLESMSPTEVWARLSKAENTTSGYNHLTFNNWKSFDPDATSTSATIFSICLECKRVRESWKSSRTMFIPNRGCGDSPTDWRSIALCCTISKLFIVYISKHIANWALKNEILCPA